jgi:hypothetical protein
VGPLGQVRDPVDIGSPHPDLVAVVLNDADPGKLPRGGGIGGAGEEIPLDRAVTPEAYGDLVGSFHLDAVGRAGGKQVGGPHNPVHAEDAQTDIGDVERPAVPLAVAGGLVRDLGQHAAHVASLGNQVTVAAVRAGDVVVAPQGLADPYGNRFLADVQVRHAAEASGEEQVLDLRLPQTDLQHVCVHRGELLRG